jgi:hypothetical protein
VEDLRKQERPEAVAIVPMGIRYAALDQPWPKLVALLQDLEHRCGITASPQNLGTVESDRPLTPPQEMALYRRLFGLGEQLLSQMENFYRQFYSCDLPAAPPQQDWPTEMVPSALNEQLAERLNRLLDTALQVSEHYFGLEAQGNFPDRCRRLEQVGWDRIFREDLKAIETLPTVERELADRVAEEANLRLWHMRLVETFVAVTGSYVIEKPTFDRFAETTLLLWNVITRIEGKVPFPRPRLAQQRVVMTIGEPLWVSERWPDYEQNRRQAIATLTQDLQARLQAMI